ncbi:hypothetical protein LXA43DRAFT_1019001 [Ganoderma leucocontextum]|nr:hypothetical protein LXA43DRAFT_1019001 [Ganoderma leucocontextum]
MPQSSGQVALRHLIRYRPGPDKMSTDAAPSVPNANRLRIHDLPADVLILLLSLLHGQDIARCVRVCRCFADLIHSHLYLQYRIELAQNGMVDGDSSTLPVSERLQRLRQYSSNFLNGIFDREDLTAHPDYILQMRNLRGRLSTTFYNEGSSSVLYGNLDGQSESFLSVFAHGSARAGIQSRRWLMPLGTPEHPGRIIRNWAIGGVQDLLVIAEVSLIDTATQMSSRPPEVRFFSLSGSETTATAHPAATLPCLQVVPPGGVQLTANVSIFNLCITRERVIWEIGATSGEVRNYLIEVCNWRTGQAISRIELGTQPEHVVPLGNSYLLVTPQDPKPYLNIYSVSPSIPNRPICTLQLPALNPGQRWMSCEMPISQRPSTLEGHFRADRSLSMVVLTHDIHGPEGPWASHLLIPCAALLTQIHSAVSQQAGSADLRGPPEGSPVLVPWKDWGPRGCLRLRLRRNPQQIHHLIRMIPFGSRMPIVEFHDPRFRSSSVYVFDINPLAARHVLAARGHESETTAIVEDVEATLPGVVDPDCSAIPYVVYRFMLPDAPRGRPYGHPVWSVEMSMTGFAIVFGGVSIEDSLQTWTV